MKYFFTVLSVVIIFKTYSQSLSPAVINTAGVHANGNGCLLDYSVGEFAIGNLINENISYNEGFLQPDTFYCLKETIDFSWKDSVLNTHSFDAILPVNHSLVWSFGDGAKSYEKRTTHIFAANGKYEICLNSVGVLNCKYQICKSLESIKHFSLSGRTHHNSVPIGLVKLYLFDIQKDTIFAVDSTISSYDGSYTFSYVLPGTYKIKTVHHSYSNTWFGDVSFAKYAYSLSLTGLAGSVDINLKNNITMNISNNNLSGVFAYPNPFSSNIQINQGLGDDAFLTNVKLINSLGQIIHSGDTQQIDASSFPSGVYRLEITTKRGKYFSNTMIKVQ